MGLKSDEEALFTAFTEIITGRAPEKRGNGLKYVRRNVEKGFFQLEFWTGNAHLLLKVGRRLSGNEIKSTKSPIPGCMAMIKYGIDEENTMFSKKSHRQDVG